MYSKQLAIFLSLTIAASVLAKPAPSNTFKIEDSNPISVLEAETIRNQIHQIQDKISELRAQSHDNFFVKKINEFRIDSLENKLDSKLKKQE